MFRLLAALVLVGAVASGTASAQNPAPTPLPIDPRLLVIGDSVSLGAQPWIVALLDARGWRVNQTSRESMHTWEANWIVDDNRAHGGIGDVVVVQLGTNDGSNPALLTTWMDQLLARLSTVDRVYWVNLRQFRSWVPAANAAIAAEASRWPNVRIIDWDARATPDPSLVYADGYHLNPAGQVAMAVLITDTLDGFIRETAPTVSTTTLPPTSTSASVSASSTRVSRSDGGSTDAATLAVGVFVTLGLAGELATRARHVRGIK